MIKIEKGQKYRYIDILKKTMILPFKVNIVHYFAFTNNSYCVKKALNNGTSYNADSIG